MGHAVLPSDEHVKEEEGTDGKQTQFVSVIYTDHKHAHMYGRYMKQTWGKSPFLGRLRPVKSTSENPEYMSMCTSGVVVVVLLFKWYCLEETEEV